MTPSDSDEARFVDGTVTEDWNDDRTARPLTEAGRRLLADMETYRTFSTHGRAEGVNVLDPWEAIRRRLVGPEGILAIEDQAAALWAEQHGYVRSSRGWVLPTDEVGS